MFQYRLVKTRWGIVAYVARADKLVNCLLPPELPKEKLSSIDEKRQRKFQTGLILAQYTEAKESDDLLPQLARGIQNYFAGSPVHFTCPVDISTRTAFTQSVLKLTVKIPFGKTLAYRDLAKKIGNPRAVRAVARALASNPIPLVIPCHRVKYADGSLGGFSAPCGIAMKKRLLELESAK